MTDTYRTPNSPLGSLTRGQRFVIRCVISIIVLAALVWSSFAVWHRHRTKPLVVTATRILHGDNYSQESLRPILNYLERAGHQDCSILRHAAVIRLYVAALSQGKDDGPETMAKAEATTRHALACAPSDGYLWFSLFWIGYARASPPATILPFLEMSYRTAPNEGWISQFRARVALQYVSDMNPDFQKRVEQEFRNVVRDSPRSAASALRDADRDTRGVMLRIVADLPLVEREKLAKVLESRDVNVDIPGVDYSQWYRGKK
jgi:hypothetical protein